LGPSQARLTYEGEGDDGFEACGHGCGWTVVSRLGGFVMRPLLFDVSTHNSADISRSQCPLSIQIFNPFVNRISGMSSPREVLKLQLGLSC
jgi:hypothetical protein